MGKAKISTEVLYTMDDEANEKITFGIFAVVRDGDVIHSHQIKTLSFSGNEYIESKKSIESNMTAYYKKLCILTKDELDSISFLKK